jgi:sialate O-acetylesterase
MIFCLAIMILASGFAGGADGDSRRREWKKVVDLRGDDWRFELGDDPKWAQTAFDDSNWEEVFVPAPWEDEGYPGYDGYAWYRKRFNISSQVKEKNLYIHLGQIDDADEVYINGHFVGFSGTFPPDYYTGFNVYRKYPISPGILKFDSENVLAVRVYDEGIDGGIVSGNIGIFEKMNDPQLEVNLSGKWLFTTGDDEEYQQPDFNDRNWTPVHVPAYWETQGFKDYDGFGWYRTKFTIPKDLQEERLILLLGKIDDFDEVYLNGERIGRTGRMREGRRIHRDDLGGEYLEQRVYYIPTSLGHFDKENTLAVRVYDGWIHGGIYDGPIGITTRETYREWEREYRDLADYFNFLWR